ncbi:MAG: hypothetical protein D3903_17830 [Candidatus Electrothrix sp. GM3_4]|nr:hypothetical protein [Candidatus Electrothrix sp. GM3_4]
MAQYYVNTKTDTNPNNNHEVHTSTCHKCPSENNRKYLGVFANCQDAVKEAKKTYSNVDGCIHCCKPCHNE